MPYNRDIFPIRFVNNVRFNNAVWTEIADIRRV